MRDVWGGGEGVYPNPIELNYWKAAEGIFIKPSDPLPRVGGVHDEL